MLCDMGGHVMLMHLVPPACVEKVGEELDKTMNIVGLRGVLRLVGWIGHDFFRLCAGTITEIDMIDEFVPRFEASFDEFIKTAPGRG